MEVQAKTLVTLVHGTFARNADWTVIEPPSQLCKVLATALPGPIEFKKFSWSGKNTHAARRKAADELRKQLAEQIDELPNATHFVVAHSHGGNIALYALADPVLDKIKAVVCLDTPFINALHRNANNFRRQISFLVSVLGAGAGALSLFVLLFLFFGKGAQELPANPALHVLSALITTALFLLPLSAIYWLLSRLWRLGQEKALERRERLIEELKLPEIRSSRIICLWNASDEVVALFSVLEALTHLPYILSHYLVLRFLTIAFAILIAVLVSLMGYFGYGLAKTGGEAAVVLGMLISTYTFLLVFALIAYALFVLLMAAAINWLVTRLPLGIGGLQVTDTLLVRLTTTFVPVTTCRIEFRELDLPTRQWNHCAAYSDMDALNFIAARMMAQ